MQNINMIAFDITTRCNLHCAHCRTEILDKELETNEVLHIIENVAQLKPRFISLTGGEPFMRADLEEIISKIKSFGIALQINTNSLLIEESNLAYLNNKYGIEYIQISLDGLESSHSRYRGADIFEKTIAQMKMVSKYTSLIINTTVSKLNIDDLYDMGKFLFEKQNIDCYTWGLKRIIPINEFGTTNFLAREDLLKLCKIWDNLRIKYKDTVMVKTDTPQKNILIKDYAKEIMKKYSLNFIGCAACNSNITIRANGDLSPCTLTPFNLGNLLENDIINLMNSDIMQNLINRNNFQGKCGSCDNLDLCGGCRAIAYALTNDIFGEDGSCFL